jgi:hypothetical protein
VLPGFLEAKRSGFLSEQAFKAFGAGEEKFVMVRHRYSRAFGYEWRDNALSDPIQADVFHGERLRGTQVVPIRRNDTFRLRQ